MAGKLLILQDSLQFGGHEIMFLNLLPGALPSEAFDEIVVRMPEGNAIFQQRLRDLGSPRLRIAPWRYAKRPAEPYLAGFRRDYGAAVRETILHERPQTVLLLQGRIENLAVPMLSMPKDQFTVSYIPMAHSMRDMDRNSLGDSVRRRLYRRPDRFIVPSHAVAGQLTRVGARAPATVIENIVKPPVRSTSPDIRSAFGLPHDRRIALFLGRFDPQQKGLDLLIAAMQRSAAALDAWTFLFVGDGPGLAAIEALKGGALDIRIIPWTDRPHDFLLGSDVMLMPSRYEGVPLVMLEAMLCGLPILASEIDVFREYLPAERCVNFGTVNLAAQLDALFAAGRGAAVDQDAHRIARARAQFAEALVPGAKAV
ncbi:glycosyltransferase family 4 protein [Sphingobium boeckii]|uniref:Glycosyltransferase involved in cell wall biosynthesis n=1 Tax=Sphingobium boeckii TaxID=1082345 RepID=A0A7W9AHI3_9SPHN|nr:glycosyltransferase family 4 protein [Sphingobium boeckii]MBB5685754.1 glycosyltransferase involved in cell wall biosynthesis [Sphingobium boeckii]